MLHGFFSSPALQSSFAIGAFSFAQQNTSVTNSMAADGYTWSQAYPIQVDKYGNFFALAQKTGPAHYLVYSNDAGATWHDTAWNESFLERGTIAYDATNDIIHILWNASDQNDGIIYRRYTITRSGNNISNIARTHQAQLDFTATGHYTHPILLHLSDSEYGTHGALLAIYGVNNAGVGSEIRSSLCVLNNDPLAAATTSNWTFTVTNDTNGIGIAPQIAYSKLYSNVVGNAVYPSAVRINTGSKAKDIYCFFFEGINTATSKWKFVRAAWKQVDLKWSNGLSSTQIVCNVQRLGTDIGYDLKGQLGSKLVVDSNSNVYFAFPNWKNNTDGDTWSYIYIDSNDVLSSIVDVYSAGGAHSYASSGDITYITNLIVSYTKTTTQHAYYKVYHENTLVLDEALLFDNAPVDIPLIDINGNTIVSIFRDTNIPYHGWFGSAEVI